MSLRSKSYSNLRGLLSDAGDERDDRALSILDIQRPTRHCFHMDGEWKGQTAGGNPSHYSWRFNPQYALHFQSEAHVKITLRQRPIETSPFVTMGFYLFRRRGLLGCDHKRLVVLNRDNFVSVSQFIDKETVSCELFLQASAIPYVLIPMTVRPGQDAKFTFEIESDQLGTMSLLDSDEANWFVHTEHGRLSGKTAGGCRHHITWRNNPQYIMRLQLGDPTNLIISLNQKQSPSPSDSNAAGGRVPLANIGLYIATKTTPGDIRKVTLGNADIRAKTMFQQKDEVVFEGQLSRSLYGYRIIPCTFAANEQCEFTLSVFADRPVALEEVKEEWDCLVVDAQWTSLDIAKDDTLTDIQNKLMHQNDSVELVSPAVSDISSVSVRGSTAGPDVLALNSPSFPRERILVKTSPKQLSSPGDDLALSSPSIRPPRKVSLDEYKSSPISPPRRHKRGPSATSGTAAQNANDLEKFVPSVGTVSAQPAILPATSMIRVMSTAELRNQLRHSTSSSGLAKIASDANSNSASTTASVSPTFAPSPLAPTPSRIRKRLPGTAPHSGTNASLHRHSPNTLSPNLIPGIRHSSAQAPTPPPLSLAGSANSSVGTRRSSSPGLPPLPAMPSRTSSYNRYPNFNPLFKLNLHLTAPTPILTALSQVLKEDDELHSVGFRLFAFVDPHETVAAPHSGPPQTVGSPFLSGPGSAFSVALTDATGAPFSLPLVTSTLPRLAATSPNSAERTIASPSAPSQGKKGKKAKKRQQSQTKESQPLQAQSVVASAESNPSFSAPSTPAKIFIPPVLLPSRDASAHQPIIPGSPMPPLSPTTGQPQQKTFDVTLDSATIASFMGGRMDFADADDRFQPERFTLAELWTTPMEKSFEMSRKLVLSPAQKAIYILPIKGDYNDAGHFQVGIFNLVKDIQRVSFHLENLLITPSAQLSSQDVAFMQFAYTTQAHQFWKQQQEEMWKATYEERVTQLRRTTRELKAKGLSSPEIKGHSMVAPIQEEISVLEARLGITEVTVRIDDSSGGSVSSAYPTAVGGPQNSNVAASVTALKGEDLRRQEEMERRGQRIVRLKDKPDDEPDRKRVVSPTSGVLKSSLRSSRNTPPPLQPQSKTASDHADAAEGTTTSLSLSLSLAGARVAEDTVSPLPTFRAMPSHEPHSGHGHAHHHAHPHAHDVHDSAFSLGLARLAVPDRQPHGSPTGSPLPSPSVSLPRRRSAEFVSETARKRVTFSENEQKDRKNKADALGSTSGKERASSASPSPARSRVENSYGAGYSNKYGTGDGVDDDNQSWAKWLVMGGAAVAAGLWFNRDRLRRRLLGK